MADKLTRTLIYSGSREWNRVDLVEASLEVERDTAEQSGYRLAVRHGANPNGLDAIVARWLAKHPVVIADPRPADWTLYGRGAGPIRNRVMAKAEPRADTLFAFSTRWPPTPGTGSMIEEALKVGIPAILTVMAPQWEPSC